MYTSRNYQRHNWKADKPVTSIVVPVMNEHDNVLPLVHRIAKALHGHPTEVLFVDDSRDQKTVQQVMLARIGYRGPQFDVRIYHRLGDKRWGGLSGAVADGIKHSRSDQLLVMDGDLQHPPETIPAMIAAAGINGKDGYDMVVASRYCKGGSAGGLDGGIRHLVSRGSTVLAKSFFPWRLRKVSDPMTGFFLFDRRTVDLSRLRPKGFKILLEIVASHPKLQVTEVPLLFAERVNGESHGTIKQGLEFFSQLAALRLSFAVTLFTKLPKFVQFGAIGGSVFAVGMALLALLVEVFHWSPLAANAVQLAVTFALNYVLNRRLTWRERNVSRLAANKFFVSRAVTTALNYYLFAWLISLQVNLNLLITKLHVGINYLLANVLALAVIMAINYVVSDRWAFADNADDGVAKQPRIKKARRLQRHGRVARVSYSLAVALATVVGTLVGFHYSVSLTISSLLAALNIIMFVQAAVEVWRMVYAYREPDAVDKLKFPRPLRNANGQEILQENFCLIVPARHESAVLASTLLQLAKQTHPNLQIITVMCDDDYDTLRVAYQAAAQEPRIRVVQYPLLPDVKPSKPKQLNYVLEQIKGEPYSVIGVIDAEDSVNPELLRHIDAAFNNPDRATDQEIGIVQGGVQLINHDSSWFALHNVLEYYRWFNSAMAFQADKQFMPLGGNTIFIRRHLLQQAGGWPDTLTEDCSLGVLLSSRYHTNIAVHYEPALATREETPDSLEALFRQRVRWNQGFFHEWRRGIWHDLPSRKQRLLAGYVLFAPVLLTAIGLLSLLGMVANFFLNGPVALVLIMYLPLVPVALLFALNVVFLRDFGKAYARKITLRQYVSLTITYFPYLLVLNLAALWSIVRELRGDTSWYKTAHSGLHREAGELEPAYQEVTS